MNRRVELALCLLFFLLASISHVYAADETFFDSFLGSPLLVLVVMIIIVGIAFVYHKIRK